MPNSTVAWLVPFLNSVWKYTKSAYGVPGEDRRLFAILHSGKYEDGHAITFLDRNKVVQKNIDIDSGRGNLIDVGSNNWTFSNGGNLDRIIQEISKLVEFSTTGVKGSPAKKIWRNKWSEIFTYDVYTKLSLHSEATRYFNLVINKTEDFPMSGTMWFKDWFYPIYQSRGKALGGFVLKRFFNFFGEQEFPYNFSGSYGILKLADQYTRDMNMGEFVHFWSGAAGKNLKKLATLAFGWNVTYEEQYNNARKEFSYPRLPYNQSIRFMDGYFAGPLIDLPLTGNYSNGLIEHDFANKTSSAHISGCIVLYSQRDCQGRSVVISDDPRNQCPRGGSLSACDFDNMASSFNDCFESSIIP